MRSALKRANEPISDRPELRTVTLRLPMPENATNLRSGGGHWRSVHNAKRKYQKELTLLYWAGLLPRAPETPFQRVIISSVMKLGGGMDDDNAVARHKSALDWLKDRKGEGHRFIIDDRRSFLRWSAFPRQIVKRDGDYWLEITLREVENFSELEKESQ